MYFSKVKQTWFVDCCCKVGSTSRDWVVQSRSDYTNQQASEHNQQQNPFKPNQSLIESPKMEKYLRDEECRIVVVFLGFNDARYALAQSQKMEKVRRRRA
jgi:hypothetical protein